MAAMLILAAAVAGAAVAAPDPVAPAWRGEMQCYGPDIARRTCNALGSYARNADGGIDNTAIVLVSPSPPVTMTTVTRVVIKAGQVCGQVREQDIDAARFAMGGQLLDAVHSEALRREMKAGMQTIAGHEICTAYVPDGDLLAATVTVDGVARPELDDKVVWIAPAAGYKVAP